MNHQLATPKKEVRAAHVIGMYDGQSLQDHVFVKGLPLDDARYLKNVAKQNTGKAGHCMHYVLPSADGVPVFVFGLGKKEEWTQRKLVVESRKIFSIVKGGEYKNIRFCIDDFRVRTLPLDRIAEIIATNLEMASYEFNRYKEEPKEGWFFLDTAYYETKMNEKRKAIARGLAVGQIIGQQVNVARDLSNTPGGMMTPKLLARHARTMGSTCGVKVTVMGETEMKKLGMGAILAVSKGSKEEAQFIVMEYKKGSHARKAPIVFVGKGITFDSGGLHLKPGNAMDDMHLDMSGGAAVIGALGAIARMGLATHVIGLVAAVENMPSGESYRPGDILTSMSGTTIEVVSPDAEGRVTLADALWYAKKFNPSLVIDIATLTGACSIALGHHASALFSPHESTAQKLLRLGEESGDYLWRLPLWEEYECGLKGTFGDLLNAPKNREAGSINAALFLSHWTKDFPAWAHIDIASTMLSTSDMHLAKGASGTSVRFLVEVARSFY